MIYRNAEVFIDGHFRICDFEVIDGRFVAIGNPYLPAIDEAAGDEETNLDGRWVIPGLVDVHTHGSMNADFSDGDYEGLKNMAAYLARSGVTSFAPAGMTAREGRGVWFGRNDNGGRLQRNAAGGKAQGIGQGCPQSTKYRCF